MAYDRRVEVLFDETEFKALEAEAKRRKQSMGAVVREAVGKYVAGPRQEERLVAVRRMAARKGPVGSPEEIKQAILDSQLRGILKSLETD